MGTGHAGRRPKEKSRRLVEVAPVLLIVPPGRISKWKSTEKGRDRRRAGFGRIRFGFMWCPFGCLRAVSPVHGLTGTLRKGRTKVPQAVHATGRPDLTKKMKILFCVHSELGLHSAGRRFTVKTLTGVDGFVDGRTTGCSTLGKRESEKAQRRIWELFSWVFIVSPFAAGFGGHTEFTTKTRQPSTRKENHALHPYGTWRR